MRSSEQITRTVSEYHEWQAAQRRKALRQALAMLRRARETDARWYRWIVDGRPVLSEEEFQRERVMPARAGRGRAT